MARSGLKTAHAQAPEEGADALHHLGFAFDAVLLTLPSSKVFNLHSQEHFAHPAFVATPSAAGAVSRIHANEKSDFQNSFSVLHEKAQ